MPLKDKAARCDYSNRYNKKWYRINREWRIAQIRKSNDRVTAELKSIVISLKESQPCTDCGLKYRHWIMDFDHVRGSKLMDICKMVFRSVSRKRLMEEISKCEIVCSNCHRDRTYKRRTAELTQLVE